MKKILERRADSYESRPIAFLALFHTHPQCRNSSSVKFGSVRQVLQRRPNSGERTHWPGRATYSIYYVLYIIFRLLRENLRKSISSYYNFFLIIVLVYSPWNKLIEISVGSNWIQRHSFRKNTIKIQLLCYLVQSG